MKFSLLFGIACVVLAVVVAGCTQPPANPQATTSPTTAQGTPPVTQPPTSDAKTLLTGGVWMLESMVNNGTVVNLVPNTTITAAFTANGALNGSSGCNSYFASYNVTGNAIKIGKAVSTLMFCGEPTGIMDQESKYLGMLQNASTFTVSATELTVSDTGGRNQLIYQKYQPLPLTGSWKLDSMGEGNTVSRLINGTNITAVFASDGNLTGSAGCNNYFTGYKVMGDNLTISDIGSTRMFCGEPPGIMDQESKYLRILRNSTNYSILGNPLTLMDARGRPTLFYFRA